MPVKGWIPKSIRRLVIKAKCEKCGSESHIGLHHKDQDRSNNLPQNLETLCASCHTKSHWNKGKKHWRRHPATCVICGKPAKRSGLCETHRTRFRRYGDPCLVRIQIGHTWQLIRDVSIPSGLTFQGLQQELKTESNASADLAIQFCRKSPTKSLKPSQT